MTHMTISYADETNADEKAVSDIREWCTDRQWNALCQMRDKVLREEARFDTLVIALSFIGVSGFPVHAFGRTFCPDAYTVWMSEPEIE